MFSFLKKNKELNLTYNSRVNLGLYSFHLIAFLGNNEIGKARGYIQKSGEFRLVKVDVYVGYRSNGYGSRMIEKLLAEARKDGCTSFVFVGVSHSNTDAIRLYERLGAERKPILNCDDKSDYVMTLN
ncbi:GNAT family N-acetyltransferase [Vibrio antiquarius]